MRRNLTRRAPAAAAVLALCLAGAGCGDDADRVASGPPAAFQAVAEPVVADPPESEATPDGSGGDAGDAADPSAGSPVRLPAPPAPDGKATADRRLTRVATIRGGLTPKSVVHSGNGYFVAQNMMYSHTIGVYERSGARVALIRDTIKPADYGWDGLDAPLKGGPVEAAFAPDKRHVWISQYSMIGPGFSKEGKDACSPADGYDDSFVYRIDTSTWKVDGAARVGAVPKYVAVVPDGSKVLVSNWCSYSLSVVDAGSARETRRIDLGRFPRGIAVSPDGRTAYVALMGADRIAVVDLRSYEVRFHDGVGRQPRHLQMSPDGKRLYVSLNGEGAIVAIDPESGRELGRAVTGKEARSMVLTPDGSVIYGVNYAEDTISVVTTKDMRAVQKVSVPHHPIGITWDDQDRRVWVACYSGALAVLQAS